MNFFKDLFKQPAMVIIVLLLLIAQTISIFVLISEVDKIKTQLKSEPKVDETKGLLIKAGDKKSVTIMKPKTDVVIGRYVPPFDMGPIGEKFSYTYCAFKTFNGETDTNTVNDFLHINHHFGLDTTDETFMYSVGQILLESGAKQRYPKGHPRVGQLVLSSAGATGFCQIMPNTALGTLKQIKGDGVNELLELGASDFSSVTNASQAREWLSDKRNNMILWGYIMRSNLKKRGNILKALVGYNAGGGGLNKFLKAGGDCHNHSYVRGIGLKLSQVNFSDPS